MKLKVGEFEKALQEVKRLVDGKLDEGDNADEFVDLGKVDGLTVYVASGKTVRDLPSDTLHENPADVFFLVLEGEMEFTFEDGEKMSVKKGQYCVFPKHVKHLCHFKKRTVTIEVARE